MRIAVTGATGFLGRYLVAELVRAGHVCRCWHRSTSDRGGFEDFATSLEWLPGQLSDLAATESLVHGCDAVVHAALMRSGRAFRGGEDNLIDFFDVNLMGALKLIESARAANVGRFIFISTCAVHERILDDRSLDESHPLWPTSHYGAHKAALEKFVHSYGLGMDYPICALRPTGIYGLARPVANSKWYPLVRSVVRDDPVECQRGGKEVHAADVAKAALLLLTADEIAGQVFNCYDRYVSDFDVATVAKELADSKSPIIGAQTQPKHQIANDKIRALGMEFGGEKCLRATVKQLVDAVRSGDTVSH